MATADLVGHVQSRFPFLGVDRKPGDIIEPEDLAMASRTALDALVNQKLLILAPRDGVESDAERVQALQASVDALRDEVRALRDTFAPASLELVQGEALIADDRIPALETAVAGLSGQIDAMKVALPAAVQDAVRAAMASVNAQPPARKRKVT